MILVLLLISIIINGQLNKRNMKLKLLFTALILMSFSTSIFSQHRRGSTVRFKDSGKTDKQIMKESYSNETPERIVEISATYNYQFGGKFYYYVNGYKELRVSDSDSYGINLSFPSKWNTRVELAFFNQGTTVSGDRDFGREDISVRYYQIGVVKEMPKGNLIPYGTFSVGAVELNPDGQYDDIWKFALTLGGGMKYYFTKNIGLKLEARMLVPIAYGGLYFGTGGSGVSASSATVQGYIGAGATFALTR